MCPSAGDLDVVQKSTDYNQIPVHLAFPQFVKVMELLRCDYASMWIVQHAHVNTGVEAEGQLCKKK